MNVKLVKLFGWFGIAGPVIGIPGTLFSIVSAPWFSWTANSIVDLLDDSPSSLLFRTTWLMWAGCVMAFSAGIYEVVRDNRVGKAGFGLNLMGAALLFVSTLPGFELEAQRALVNGFYITTALSMFPLAIHLRRKDLMRLSYVTVLTGGVALIAWSLGIEAPAVPEFVSSLAFGVWSVTLGAWMVKRQELPGMQ